MKAIVLLSDARHPVSGRSQLSRLEAQAIGLAAGLDAQARGLHAGSAIDGVQAGLGHGLTALDIVDLPEGGDPLPALSALLKARMETGDAPDVIFCGRRGEGGEETGMVPYLLADRLGLPIVADAVAVLPGETPGTLVVDQAMEKGARRRVTVRLPVIVTVHPLAPPPVPFAFGRMRKGTLRRHVVEKSGAAHQDLGGLPDAEKNAPEQPRLEERPHRSRPKLMRTGGTAAGGHNLHVGPEPDEAARLILDYLESNGIRRYGDTPS